MSDEHCTFHFYTDYTTTLHIFVFFSRCVSQKMPKLSAVLLPHNVIVLYSQKVTT